MFVTWKRNVLFETAVLFAERWRHLTYSNEPNFINNALYSNEHNLIYNALLVAKEYFHFKLSNVTKRATIACAQCASRTAVLACSQCVSCTEAPSNGLSANERTNERTEDPHSHVDFLNLYVDNWRQLLVVGVLRNKKHLKAALHSTNVSTGTIVV